MFKGHSIGLVVVAGWAPLAGLANDQQHWAFMTPKNPVMANIESSDWPRNEIDYFVLAKMEKAGITPSDQALRHTLINRLSLDLTGLPPSPGEVEAFNNDLSPNAYANLVEHLLASPHYGERMAQNWFDLARFADTSGYAADRTRIIWPYREWVIGAFNKNQPYDQFSIDQLAGDIIPNATLGQKVASAFHRNAMQAKGNNPRKEEFRVKGIVDRLETTGRTWLGLTLECAECHEHKHDPISQEEYYQLFAIFNNVPHLGTGYGVHGPMMRYTPPEVLLERQRLATRLGKLRGKLGRLGQARQEGLIGEWQATMHMEDASRFSLAGSLTITADIQTTAEIGDIVSKYDWQGEQRSFVFGVGGEGDAKAEPGKLFAWFSSEAATFNGVVTYGSQVVNDGKPHHVAVAFDAGRSVRFFVDGIEDKSMRIEGVVPRTLARSSRGLAIGVGYNNSQMPNAHRFAGRMANVRLYDQVLADPSGLDPSKAEIPEYLHLGERLAELDVREMEIPVMDELPEPRPTYVHVRGNFKTKGERVQPGVPRIFHLISPGKPGQPVNRLDFARWLFADEHPLTARVAVNRIWQHHFGEGLVRTTADFGQHGDRPSHPALLDWLAVRFVDSEWDIKAMHRLIVKSATYRQASIHRTDLQEADPGNRLLARFPRVRLPAEQIRDGALAVSGQLQLRIGGPSVFPSQPSGLYEERGQNLPGNSNFNWKNSTGADSYRRSIYTYWKRMMLHPVMATFDAPTRMVCVPKRQVTNTPLQALVGLNEPAMFGAAKALANRLANAGLADDSAKVRAGYLLCLSRFPEPTELSQCLSFLERQRRRQKNSDDEWAVLVSVFLNLDERLTRE